MPPLPTAIHGAKAVADGGVNVFLPWGLIEWAVAAAWAAGTAVVIYVYRLGRKVDRLELLTNSEIERIEHDINSKFNVMKTAVAAQERNTQQRHEENTSRYNALDETLTILAQEQRQLFDRVSRLVTLDQWRDTMLAIQQMNRDITQRIDQFLSNKK